ncbi:hypothetical protein FD723_39995 (plasmid) [Nostoc sp. C052]|uniref:hypothetical protein n=1 Tax=Nostoc sp. C052 TaxID=2576902 RepID=UPI0015C38DE1|nr:hypothetical protein [Nostoc sp. C052]QLE46396.1 hypothetical protein FD723_39995 [Nostoc sp. C052]
MPYRRRFYENLPIYARLADEQQGLLRHICDAAIQPELDKIYEAFAGQEYYYDPNHPLSWDHLDWLGQFVGLGMIEDHWLGIGINPDWPIAWKIDAISRAWNYWQIKGSEAGIREAVAIWLRFDDKKRFLLKLPFGQYADEGHPGWWDYETVYDDHLNKTFPERRNLAWGNHWGQQYRANYYSIQSPYPVWDYLDLWSDKTWNYLPPHETIYDRSRLGDRELWMHFYLKEWEWNQIFPNILTLNIEILPATTTATIFGWIELSGHCSCLLLERDDSYIKTQTFIWIELDGLQYGQLVTVNNQSVPQPTLPNSSEFYIYGGDLYPYETNPEYYTLENVSVETAWGVWEPDFWDGQWWAKTISVDPGIETLNFDSFDVAELGFVETLSAETFTIDLIEFPLLGFPGGELWYAAWDIYKYQEVRRIYHESVGCTQGIAFLLPGDELQLTIDLGGIFADEPNQHLTLDEFNDFVLEEPIKIATYIDEYDQGLPYLSASKNTRPLSAAAYPSETFSIEIDFEPVDTMAINSLVSGYLCNVFGGFSTLTPVSITKYQVEIKPEHEYSWADIYPILAKVNNGELWTLVLETDEEVFLIKPTTMFWFADEEMNVRSPSFSFQEGTTNLYMEFVFKPKQDTHIRYAGLSLETEIVQSETFYYVLNVPAEIYVGLIFKIPLRLPTSLDTPEEEMLLEEILPLLTQELRTLAGLRGDKVPELHSSQPFLDCCMPNETLKELLISIRDTIKEKSVVADKHYLEIIATPTMSITVYHNLLKYPAVTFIDTIAGNGRRVEGTVDYINTNSVTLTFSEPTTGRVFFN